MCKQILDQTIFCSNQKKCGLQHCSISHDQTRKGPKFNNGKKKEKIQSKECSYVAQPVIIQTQFTPMINHISTSPYIELSDIVIFPQCYSNAYQNIFQFNYLNLIKVVQNAILLKQIKHNKQSNQKLLLKLCLCDSSQNRNTQQCNLNFCGSLGSEVYNYVTQLNQLYKKDVLLHFQDQNQALHSVFLNQLDNENQYTIIINRVDELLKDFTFTQIPSLISKLNQILTHTQNQIKSSQDETLSENLQQLHKEITELIKIIQSLKVKIEDDIQDLPTMIYQYEIKRNNQLGVRAIYYNESLMGILAEDNQQLIYDALRNDFPKFYSSDNYFETMFQIVKTIPTDFNENQLIHNYSKIDNISLRSFDDKWINNTHLYLNFYQYKTKNFFIAFQIYSFEKQNNSTVTPNGESSMNLDQVEQQCIIQESISKFQQQFNEEQAQTCKNLKSSLIKVRDFVNLYYEGKFPEVLNQYVNREDDKMLIQCSYKMINQPKNYQNNSINISSNVSQCSGDQSTNMEYSND